MGVWTYHGHKQGNLSWGGSPALPILPLTPQVHVPPAQDTTVVQLIPYGWELPDGYVLREADYKGMAKAANSSYFRWINPYPQHAYFKRFASTQL